MFTLVFSTIIGIIVIIWSIVTFIEIVRNDISVKANFVPDEIPSLSPGDENYGWCIIDAIESMRHLRQQMT